MVLLVGERCGTFPTDEHAAALGAVPVFEKSTMLCLSLSRKNMIINAGKPPALPGDSPRFDRVKQ
jgi:hypothetical protein